jgi:hypothetical protein
VHRHGDLAWIGIDEGRKGEHGRKAKARENGDDEEKPKERGHLSLLKR